MCEVLLVEDDKNLRWMIHQNLQREGFQVKTADSGRQAFALMESNDFGVYLLDVMLPDTDGFEIARRIRERSQHAPILFLTARARRDDVAQAFESGADDYITKPFDMEELSWRMKAASRRTKHRSDGYMEWGPLQLDVFHRSLTIGAVQHMLTPTEVHLLSMLFNGDRQWVERKQILEKVWGRADAYTAGTMDVHLTKIRKYFTGTGVRIANLRGVGYRLQRD